MQNLELDVVIFGGGAAGLWLLDELVRAGYQTLLLEAHELGGGQTIASQGIIHGGLKYTLSGLLTPSAQAISGMPLMWRRCLAGEAEPNLAGVRLRAPHCHLWRTASITSKLAMIGARAGLRVTPVALDEVQRPSVLAECPGAVARLDEQVIEPSSFLVAMADRHRSRLLKVDFERGVRLEMAEPSRLAGIALRQPDDGRTITLRPNTVVLCAGAGNAGLLAKAGRDRPTMQRRPLHMLMLRGDLPVLNGHCVDGSKTRVTITSTRDSGDRTVWQVGGEIAEAGVALEPDELIEFGKSELPAVLPGIDLRHVEWSTYRVDRAEPKTRGGRRPDDSFGSIDGNIITAWPAKLALAPDLAQRTLEMIRRHAPPSAPSPGLEALGWPSPTVAMPPWETAPAWFPAS